VPSPALYSAPVEVSDADLLAQSIALPLLHVVLAQARERHGIETAWQPLLYGLYLWHVWAMDLPLATWRTEVVPWLYRSLPTTQPRQPLVLLAHYRELCTAHKLWLQSPLQIGIPLLCTERKWETWQWTDWPLSPPLTRLAQLSVPQPKPLDSISWRVVHHPSQTVALATLIEYAVATYGRERLPGLVAGLGQHESWETLLPAVYGVSATEFEAGWRAYLVLHYGALAPSPLP
jgi:hypothetical protein